MDREAFRIALDNINDRLRGSGWRVDPVSLGNGRLLLWNDAFTHFPYAPSGQAPEPAFHRGYFIEVEAPKSGTANLVTGWFDCHYPDEAITDALFHPDYRENVAPRFGLGLFLRNACPPELVQRFVPVLREYQNAVGHW